MKTSRNVSWIWIALGCVVLFFVAMLGSLSLGGSSAGFGPHVAVVTLSGVISDTEVRGLLGGRSGGTRGFIAELEKAAKNPAAKAIVLRINSPGGSAAASQEMFAAIMRARKEKPIIASMGDVAASGGYYLAAGCDKIYANPATVTGSIGVISQFLNYEGLFRKLGLNQATLKSGTFKDAGNPARPLTAAERQLFQALIRNIYLQFVDDVVVGRNKATGGKLTRAKVLQAADGRVYTGLQAKKLNLVDEIGGLHDAVQNAGKIAGIEGEIVARDVDEGSGGLGSLLGVSSQTPLNNVAQDLGAGFGSAAADAFSERLQGKLSAQTPVPQLNIAP